MHQLLPSPVIPPDVTTDEIVWTAVPVASPPEATPERVGRFRRVRQFLRAQLAPAAAPAPHRGSRRIAMDARNARDRHLTFGHGPRF